MRRTAECAATFEEHSSKVWCIDIVGDRMVSGGADSKICPLAALAVTGTEGHRGKPTRVRVIAGTTMMIAAVRHHEASNNHPES